MATKALKLKQASAVLKVQPKELQNLVQFGVVKPTRSAGTYLFDRKALLTAKVAFCLKDSLGTRANILTKLIDAYRSSEEQRAAKTPKYVVFNCRFSADEEPIKLGVPLRSLEKQIQQGMGQVELYRDLPRGRKSAEWKQAFLETLSEAAKDMGDLSNEDILKTIQDVRQERRMPEITIAAES